MSHNTLTGDGIDAALIKFTEAAARRRQLNAHGLFRSAGELPFDYYLRIGGRGEVRMVSLAALNPCGEVLVDGRTHGYHAIDRILATIADGPSLRIAAPGAHKREHGVQAFLIRESLRSPADAPRVLGCADLYAELVFVTDEFRINDKVRADMLMLGRAHGAQSWMPVFIELKAKRSVAEPMRQLANIVSLSTGTGAPFMAGLDGRDPAAAASLRRIAFTELLRAATGIAAPISLDARSQIVVMPASEDGKPTRRKSAEVMEAHGVHLVEYTEDRGYAFKRAVRGG